MATLDTARVFNIDIIARRGDTLNVELSFEDDQGNPIDMTGSTFRCNVLSIEFSAPGTLKIIKPSADMATMGAGDYNYDIEETRVDSTVKTLVSGILRIKNDYTI